MERLKTLLLNVADTVRTRTVQQSIITSSSTVINGLLGVSFYILVARVLGPATFGILTVALATLTLISDIATVGTDTGIVKFVGQYFQSDKEKALRFLKLGLEIKIIVGILVLVLGYFIAPFAANTLLNKPELTIPLRFAVVGAFGTLLFTFATSSLQSIQKFWTWGIVNILSNTLRLGAILFLIYSNSLNLDLTLVSYIVCVFLGFFVSLAFLPKFFGAKNERSLVGEFLHYNKWIAMFMLVAAFSSRLDTYLTTKFLSLDDVGIYGVATGLSAVGAQVVSGITIVVAPKLAGFDSKRKAIEYLKKLQLFTVGLAVAAIVIGIPLSYYIVPLLYGREYLGSFAPLAILIVSQSIFLISIPAHASVVYYFSYPKLFSYISLVHLFIIGGLGWILISNYGYIGAALTVLVGNVSNLIIPGVWALRKFKE